LALFRTPASRVSESSRPASSPTAIRDQTPAPAPRDLPNVAAGDTSSRALEPDPPAPSPLPFVATKPKPRAPRPNVLVLPPLVQDDPPVGATPSGLSPEVEEHGSPLAPVIEAYPKLPRETRELDAVDPYDKR
jgi:hypothetical protein